MPELKLLILFQADNDTIFMKLNSVLGVRYQRITLYMTQEPDVYDKIYKYYFLSTIFSVNFTKRLFSFKAMKLQLHLNNNFRTDSQSQPMLRAQDVQKHIKCNIQFQPDPSLVYLTTFMLGKIFTDKIASHNPGFKDLVKNAYMEVRIVFSQNGKSVFQKT